MTNQEIFDKVWDTFIIKKVGPSISQQTGCLYSNKINGYGCAIGCLIEDEELKELMDKPTNCVGTSILSILQSKRDINQKVRDALKNDDERFLSVLQQSHDYSATGNRSFIRDMEDNLKHIARTYSLKIPDPVGT